MNWKNRLTNYNFWISMFSAVLLILQALKIEFDIAYVNEIFTAVLGLLVVIGIISDPTKTTVKSTDNTKKTVKSIDNTKTIEEIKQENQIAAENQTTEQVVGEEKNTTVETITLPIEEEVKTDDVNTKNDIQAILTTISANLDEKIKELTNLNLKTMNKINEVKSENCQEKILDDDHKKTLNSQDMIKPAAAEMGNPYIDVIN